jgi:HD-GYP domain-containing protein (c-di-GMP phosphodiesterase class II)
LGLAAAATCLVVFASGVTLFPRLVFESAKVQELASTLDKAESARRYLTEKLPRGLADMARDYGTWDAMYEKATEPDLDKEWFDEEVACLVREVVINGRPLTRVALYGRDGRLLYSAGAKGPDFDAEAAKALRSDASVSGVLLQGGRAFMVAAQPVHRTGGGGEAAGALVFAQALEANMVAEMENVLNCAVEFAGLGSLQFPSGDLRWVDLPGGRAALSPPDTAFATVKVTDTRGADIGALTIARRSSLVALAKENARAAVPASAAAAAVVFLVNLAFAGAVLGPVRTVSARLREMEGAGELRPIGGVRGPSELADLVGAFDRAVSAADEARKREAEALERLANTDPLTGLANRRRFVSSVYAALADADAGGRPVSVVLFDLNGLKAVNDQLGHAAGDARLRAFAEVLALACDAGRGDVAARLGGAAGQVRRVLAGLRSDSYGEASAAARLLLMAADACDRYTLGHSERVASLAEALARALGWGEEKAARMKLAGLLHDVGRAFLPPELLSKAGELSGGELREVQAHAERGASLLALCPGLADVAGWVRHHHERLDGTGYPDGLKGAEVPPEARVLAVADAYDAMTSPRLHRAAAAPREAVERLSSDPGYDREVVAALRVVLGF